MKRHVVAAGAALLLAVPAALAAPPDGDLPLAGEGTVRLGEAEIRVRLLGEGGPSVVLVSGLAGGYEDWDAVQTALAAQARVLAWARPGLGGSSPAVTPRRPAVMAAELAELLRAVDLPPPYVLVGHSFGAIHARAFAARYPDRVAGLALVDPTHEDFRSFTPEERWIRFATIAGARYEELGPGPHAEWAGYLAEVEEDFPSVPRELPEVPVVVLKALPPPQAGALNLDPFGAWIAGRTDALLLATPEGGHAQPQNAPDLVLWSIGWVVDRVEAAGGTPAVADCPAVPGLAPLLAPGTALLVGEMHGTEQAPAFVRSVVCAGLAKGVPVTVGLEIDRADDGPFQEFLRSDGSDAARDRLLGAPFWHRPSQDGRSSRAMLDLVEDLRALTAAGDFRLLLIDRPEPRAERDRAMAERLAEAMDERPADLFVVLTGNIHNRLTRGMPWDEDLEPMAYQLRRLRPAARLVSLNMAYPGGTAWVCFGAAPSDCKAQEIQGSPAAEGKRGLELLDGAEGGPYSGRYFTGPLTASPPAVASGSSPR